MCDVLATAERERNIDYISLEKLRDAFHDGWVDIVRVHVDGDGNVSTMCVLMWWLIVESPHGE